MCNEKWLMILFWKPLFLLFPLRLQNSLPLVCLAGMICTACYEFDCQSKIWIEKKLHVFWNPAVKKWWSLQSLDFLKEFFSLIFCNIVTVVPFIIFQLSCKNCWWSWKWWKSWIPNVGNSVKFGVNKCSTLSQCPFFVG